MTPQERKNITAALETYEAARLAKEAASVACDLARGKFQDAIFEDSKAANELGRLVLNGQKSRCVGLDTKAVHARENGQGGVAVDVYTLER